MNKQWKISLAAVALAMGLVQSAYASAKAAADTAAQPITATTAAMVNINGATVDQLTEIKGLGPKKAQAIVDYRQKNGVFKSVEDLKNVPGISEKLFASIKPQVTV
ncbi:MAG: Competence protein ComEA helix-hairpin-helix repeat protein [Gammaproteobacteria bacterium]|jgi:competence protein ComEA|nr:Competence protein ComEA helix-hairpin-helix repeat protein [Gammaproteobacteria bacterium]